MAAEARDSQPIGALAQVGVSSEVYPGVAVAPVNLIDAISCNLSGKGTPIRSRAMNASRMAKKAVMGAYRADGDQEFEVTPDKVSSIFKAILSGYSVSGGSDPYTHVMKTGSSLGSLTVVKKMPQFNDQWFLFAGQYVNQLSFRADLDQILLATASLIGVNKEIITDSTAFDGAAAYSSEDPFVFHQGSVLAAANAAGTGTLASTGTAVTGTTTAFLTEVQIGDEITSDSETHRVVAVASDTSLTVDEAWGSDLSGDSFTISKRLNKDTDSWVVNILSNVDVHKGIGSGRGPQRAFAGEAMVTGSFNMVFDDPTLHAKWMGASSNASPIEVASTLQTFALQLLFTASASRSLQIDIPKAYLDTSEPSLAGRDGTIVQPVTFSGLYDSSSASDVVMTLKNGESTIA